MNGSPLRLALAARLASAVGSARHVPWWWLLALPAVLLQVRIAGLISMVDKQGAALTNDETVTLMDDVLVMAPAAVTASAHLTTRANAGLRWQG